MIELHVESILKDLGLEYKSAGPDNFRIKCLNPNHQDTKPSMFIHRRTGQYHCFGCMMKGNIFSLLQLKGYSQFDSKNYLKKFFIGGTTDEEIYKFLESFVQSRGKSNQQSNEISIEYPEHQPIKENFYLKQRGITNKEIEEWNISSVTDIRYIGWIYIPITQENVLRNYFMRSSFGPGKKYGPYPRNDILFGIDSATNITKKLYITEGIFDTIFFRRTGEQCVAALSNRLLPSQLMKLKKYSEIVIVPDNDEMGIKLIESARSLIHCTSVKVCELPKNKKDAAECSLEEMKKSIYEEKPINQYFEEKLSGTYRSKIKKSI